MGRAGPLDAKIFRQLYETHVGFVQFVVHRAGWKGFLVDDVVQESFVRLFRTPPESLDGKAVRGWLATTARRVMIDMCRKTGRETVDQDVAEQETTGALWFRDEGALERELELLVVRELVEEIGAEPGGEDFRAFYVDGLKAREIAEKRGEAISTVTTRISRLRGRFRERLKMRLEKTEARRS